MEPLPYIVDTETFKTDCASLAKHINSHPVEGFLPTCLIAVNEDGYQTALELKNLLPSIVKIERIIFDPNTSEIVKFLEKIDYTSAILVGGVKNTGRSLKRALQYLDALVADIELMLSIAVLYDRLNVTSPDYYLSPNYFGVGFPKHNYIKLPWD